MTTVDFRMGALATGGWKVGGNDITVRVCRASDQAFMPMSCVTVLIFFFSFSFFPLTMLACVDRPRLFRSYVVHGQGAWVDPLVQWSIVPLDF
jgi:hypothetical protein